MTNYMVVCYNVVRRAPRTARRWARRTVGATATATRRIALPLAVTTTCVLVPIVGNTPAPEPYRQPPTVERSMDTQLFMSPGAREAVEWLARRPNTNVPEPGQLAIFALAVGLVMFLNACRRRK